MPRNQNLKKLRFSSPPPNVIEPDDAIFDHLSRNMFGPDLSQIVTWDDPKTREQPKKLQI